MKMLGMTKEGLNSAMAPIRAKQVKAQAELEMSKIEAELLEKETEIQELCTENTIDFPKLIDSLDEMALLERRMEQYTEVLKQLFPVVKATKE